MFMKPRRAQLLASALIGPGIVLGIAVGVRPLTAAGPNQPVDPATLASSKALFSEKCSACHNLPDPVEKAYTRREWDRTVNKMLTKYGASDSISPAEATQIVNYLATFAPKGGNSNKPVDRWATDAIDVWPIDPSQTAVTNFESPAQLSRLKPISAGEKGASGAWTIMPAEATANGNVGRITAKALPAGRFSLLIDPKINAHDIDVAVRFRLESGKTSPNVGIAFGVKNAGSYQVVRYDGARDQVSVMQMQEPVHQTLQKIDVATGQDVLAAPGIAPATVANVAAPKLPGEWHTLRLLVHGTTVRAWVDRTKRISLDDASYAGGQVGLWSQGDTSASFDDWTIDVYDRPNAVDTQ